MQKHLCWFLLKWSQCFWLKVVRVIKWHTVPDGQPERRLGEETGALWLLCLLLLALILPYDGMTASISYTQSRTQDLFYLFKEGVTMTYTRYFHTKCSTGINNSPAHVFIFLNQMNRNMFTSQWCLTTPMLSPLPNLLSTSTCSKTHITFPLYSSPARTSPLADKIQAQEKHLVLKTVKKRTQYILHHTISR